MLKRVKTIFSIICTVSMLLSASAVPSYAEESTPAVDNTSAVVHNTKDYIKALDYSSTTANVEDSGFITSTGNGYLSGGCAYKKFEYACLFSQVPDYVVIDIQKTADYSGNGLGLWIKAGTNAEEIRIGGLDAATINALNDSNRTTITIPVNCEEVIEENTSGTLIISFGNIGFRLYGMKFIKSKDAFDTIGAADFDVWPIRGRCYANPDDPSQGLYADFETSYNAGYLSHCWSGTFGYENCYFEDTPDYIELECKGVKSNATINIGLDESDTNLGTFTKEMTNAQTTKGKILLPLTAEAKALITPDTLHKVNMKVNNGNVYIYSIKFFKSKNPFDKVSAVDIDVWPTSGACYNTTADPSSGLHPDFQAAYDDGYLSRCWSATYGYYYEFDKVPDYIEIECRGKQTNAAITIGLDASETNIATFAKVMINEHKTKGKILIPLTAEVKALITPDILHKVNMRVNNGDIEIYSIKFSNARDVYHDEDNQTVCIYGDSSAGTAPLDSFVALGAVFNGKQFVDVKFDNVNKDKMLELPFGGTVENTFKVLLWKDLDSISPIALPTIFE